jgi:hypothetical protein
VASLLSVLATDPAPCPYLAGMLVGFALGGFGHLVQARLVIAAGIVTIAVTTGLFIAATNPSFGA